MRKCKLQIEKCKFKNGCKVQIEKGHAEIKAELKKKRLIIKKLPILAGFFIYSIEKYAQNGLYKFVQFSDIYILKILTIIILRKQRNTKYDRPQAGKEHQYENERYRENRTPGTDQGNESPP